jgi:hypothetical protein
MHFVVVLPAGARRDERARGAHLQKHKKKPSHSRGPSIGGFFAVVMRYLTLKFGSFV